MAALALSLLLLAGLVAIDLALDSAVIAGSFVVVPLVAALFARVWVTEIVGLAATLLALASPIWTGDAEGLGYVVRIAVVVAGSVFAVAGAWARERARARAGELELLDAVGEIADGSLPLAETLAKVVDLIAPRSADFCMVDALHGGRVNRVAVRAPEAPGGDAVARGLREREPSIPDWLVNADAEREVAPFFVPRMTDEVLTELSHGPSDLEFLRSLGVRSAMIVPMIARRRVLGTLTMVMAWSGRRYEAPDLRFAQLLASRVALALDNAGLYSDLQSFQRRMDNAMSILREAVVIHDSLGELVFANPAAAETIGFDSASELAAASSAELARRFALQDESGEPVDLWQVARASSGGERQGESEDIVVRRLLEGGGESWYAVKSAPLAGPDGAPLYFVTAIEDITEIKRAEISHRMLARTAELLTSSADHRGMLSEVARLAVPDFADWCSINVPGDDDVLEQVAVAHADPAKVELARSLRRRFPVRLDDPVGLAEVLRSGVAQLIRESNEVSRETAPDAEHRRLLRDLGLRSLIMAPMTAGTTVVGAIAFANEEGSRAFDAADLEMAQEMAVRAGTAVESARVASERAQIARTLQRGLLPARMPEMEGWEAATMYRPAGELNEVGGDFYDAFSVEGGWVVAVGDVVGRGAAAASLTSLARHTIRTACKISGDPPTALRMLHQALTGRPETALCTVALIMLPASDQDDGEAIVYSAGHPLPLLLRGDDVVEVGRPGPLLGAIDGHGWRPDRVRLGRGDQLVVYTDGVTEARGASERFGEERLRQGLAGAPDPVRAVARIEVALEEFLPGSPQDDAAMVVVRRSPPLGRALASVAGDTSVQLSDPG